MRAPATKLAWTLAAGVALGVALTVSPLSIVTVALAAITVVIARRGLPADEARWLTAVLVAGLTARVLIVMALSVASIPVHDDQSAGILFGDEAYSLGRSLRTRNILLGLPASKYDYQVVFDSYANTRYMDFLSWVQLTFGPSPYAVRLLNGVLFVAGGALLYRLVRHGFGVVPSLGALVTLLFLPSLLFWSVSLLKESAYFLLAATAIAATVLAVRGASWSARIAGGALLGVCVWALADLRPGAVALTLGGLLLGLLLRWFTVTRRRMLGGALAIGTAGLVVVWSPSGAARVLSVLTQTAKQHTGHAFTSGHAYKTLDDKFYATVDTPSTSRLTLNPAEAARYVARSGAAFLTVPFPWQVATRSEMVFIPEQLVWYVLVIAALVGLRSAWRRDSLTTSLLVGYTLPLAAALALTNGNVGTLVRLRGLVTPFVIWIAALGCALTVRRLMSGGTPIR